MHNLIKALISVTIWHAGHEIMHLTLCSLGVLLLVPHIYATIFSSSIRNSLFSPKIVAPARSILVNTLSREIIYSRTNRRIPSVSSIGFPPLSRCLSLEATFTPILSINAFPLFSAITSHSTFLITLSKTCTPLVYPSGKKMRS